MTPPAAQGGWPPSPEETHPKAVQEAPALPVLLLAPPQFTARRWWGAIRAAAVTLQVPDLAERLREPFVVANLAYAIARANVSGIVIAHDGDGDVPAEVLSGLSGALALLDVGRPLTVDVLALRDGSFLLSPVDLAAETASPTRRPGAPSPAAVALAARAMSDP